MQEGESSRRSKSHDTRSWNGTKQTASSSNRRKSESRNTINTGSNQNERLAKRNLQLSLCLILLLAAFSSLSPLITSLHLHKQLGLLIFESDLIQLRSSIINVIICSLALLILHSTIYLYSIFWPTRQGTPHESDTARNYRPPIARSHEGTARLIQKLAKYAIGFLASLSGLTYLSMGLFLAPVQQVQRMPSATFDCQANLITIENCHQQYISSSEQFGSQSSVYSDHQSSPYMILSPLVSDLLFSDLSQQRSRLINQLNCLKYSREEPPPRDYHSLPVLEREPKTESTQSSHIPTRFLLHQCGLVCRPQRQSVRQFGDDLNREQQHQLYGQDTITTSSTNNLDEQEPAAKKSVLMEQIEAEKDINIDHVSLKVCFSDEFNTGSTYKQFCITNLANSKSQRDRGLTVAQLNAVLKRFTRLDSDSSNSAPSSEAQNFILDSEGDSTLSGPNNVDTSSARKANLVDSQATHYVNPLFQFESHFRNWDNNLNPIIINETIIQTGAPIGHTSMSSSSSTSSTSSPSSSTSSNQAIDSKWCRFKPIPPFIVNNKPFSDIQCSIEHQYRVSTTPRYNDHHQQDRIFLRRYSLDSELADPNQQLGSHERCNIKCKVNILYQIHRNKLEDASRNGEKMGAQQATNSNKPLVNDIHYYLPLKPCLIVRQPHLKKQTLKQYLFYRSLGDSSLMLTFLLLDLLLLIESFDYRRAQFEGKKFRLFGLLCAMFLTPIVISIIIETTRSMTVEDLTNSRRNNLNLQATGDGVNQEDDGSSRSLLNDRFLRTIIEIVRSILYTGKNPALSTNRTGEQVNSSAASVSIRLPLRSLTYQDIPFVFYAILLLLLTFNSFALPVVSSTNHIFRTSSSEALGFSRQSTTLKSTIQAGKETNEKSISKLVNDKQNESGSRSKYANLRLVSELIIFLSLVIFMGIQLSFSQTLPVNILVDAFGDPMGERDSESPLAMIWFTISFWSTGHLLIILGSILFADELNGLFANLNPFDTSEAASSSERNRMKLLKFLSVSLFIYSIRFYMLANLSTLWQQSKQLYTRILITLFQLAELLNFPVTWLVLCGHAQRLQTQIELPERKTSLRDDNPLGPYNQTQIDTAEGSRRHKMRWLRPNRFNVHLAIQSSVGLLYFVVARAFALLAHSMYISSHLHSDNIDWFINSFYQGDTQVSPKSASLQRPKAQAKPRFQNQSFVNYTTNGNSNSKSVPQQYGPISTSGSESLFSPLPSDQQTYLYATKIFIKYNALICLLIALVLLINLMYLKYRAW